MFKTFFLIIPLILNINSQDLSHLGDEINAQVQASLAGLDGLGERISNTVNRNLSPLDDLGDRIANKVNMNLGPLKNLGSRINEQVEKSLEPLHELTFKLKIKSGGNDGGVTLAKYQPSGKIILWKNGKGYICKSDDDDDDIEDFQCKGGDVIKFQPKNTKDYCYVQSYTYVNGYYCFTNDGNGVIVTTINGRINCSNNDGSPAILIKENEFDNICQNNIQYVDYYYNGPISDKEEKFVDKLCLPNNKMGTCHLKEEF